MFAIDTTFTTNTSTTCLWQGGDGVLYASGTFGSGTVTLAANSGGGNATNDAFIALGSSTTLTSNGIAGFTLAAGMTLKVTVSGGTSQSIHVVVATKY
jgi:hypothetical protein